MSVPAQTLFDLLPALYRLRDAKLAQSQNLAMGPLQSLLMLIDEQFQIMSDDLNQRYDDQFIETCAPWVIPYIGDLIGYQLVNGLAPAVASPRAEVANTVSFRRRKGTVLVLEQLARDVTGWGARAVEFFQQLATAQYMKHCRLNNYYAPDLHSWQPQAYMDTAFDTSAHLVDVRRISAERGRYNIQNLGIFLWSLNTYGLNRVPATAVDAGGQLFRLNPLGTDLPLFNRPISQGSTISAAAAPVNVPDRLRRRVLNQDIQAGVGAMYYGAGASVALYLNGELLNPYQVQVCNLAGADGHWSNLPTAGNPYTVCFDPQLGRLALVTALDPPPAAGAATPLLQVSYCYGFGADMGGGPYSRAESFAVQSEGSVFPFPDTADTPRYNTLQEAVNFAADTLSGIGQAAIEITDDGIYPLPASPALEINVPAGATLELRAAEGSRPTLLIGGEITVTGGGAQSSVNLNGLVIAYAPPTPPSSPPSSPPPSAAAPPAALLHVPSSAIPLGNLGIAHCTLVPGPMPSLLAESAGLQITAQKSILGALWVSGESAATLSDAILDATDPTLIAYAAEDGAGGGGGLTLQGCTVIGKIHAQLLALISDSILSAELAPADTWSAALWADRKQQGCVRCSYLPAGSIVPGQFECVVHAADAPQPLFYSTQYGDPGYCKLLPSTDDAIRRGADDEGEMGAFHFVLAPLRENDLRVRLAEYLPAGLEFGIFYQT